MQFIHTLVSNKIIQRFTGFSVVGIIVTLFSMLLMYLFNEVFYMNVYIAYTIAYILSILVSFVLNSLLVFKVKAKSTAIFWYYVIYLFSMVFGLLILNLFTYTLPDWNKTLLSYMVIPFTMVFNFIFVSKLLNKK